MEKIGIKDTDVYMQVHPWITKALYQILVNQYELLPANLERVVADTEDLIDAYNRDSHLRGRASKLLLEKGFVKVFDFSGGYSSWLKNSKQ